LIASLVLVVSLVALIEWPVRATVLFLSAERLQKLGDLEGAFQRFDLAADRLPFLAVLRQARDRSATAWAADYQGATSVAGEIRLLRRLVLMGEEEAFAGIVGQSMVGFEAGSFSMGSDQGPSDERPAHMVWLSAFRMDRYEVTCLQYHRYLQVAGRAAPAYWNDGACPPGTSDRPVVGVSWVEATAFCAWEGKRLPTEAEWERACRGAEAAVYPWGSEWQPGRANDGLNAASRWPPAYEEAWGMLRIGEEEGPRLMPVGSYLPGMSQAGVLDLIGNASEWVADWYNWAGYADLPTADPLSGGPPWNHVVRGSAWFERQGNAGLVPELSRCAARSSSHSASDPRTGFRCADSGAP
jgi:formylglycine-generating enzyme required for sulfatase activity